MAAAVENMLEKKVIVSNRSGASVASFEPKFSHDSKFLFCSSGSCVKVYSTVSGECVRNLIGHRDVVTSVYVNPRNKLQLFSSSIDQTVCVWDYQDGIQLKEYRLHFPVLAILAVFEEDIFVLCHTGHCKYDIMRYSPKNNSSKVLFEKVSRDPKHTAVNLQDKSLCTIRNKALHFVNHERKENHKHTVEQNLTCVAFHPTENCVVTGADDGKIYYWWNLGSSKKVVKSVYHWHSLPVLHLKFTVEGSYLLSGGHECVLVKWQFNSTHRDFLPRLGAPICFIACSPDNQMYATCHHDNVINLISNKFKLLQVYQGLTVGHLVSQVMNPAPCGIMGDPRTKALVTNGKPGHLQFYSVENDKQLYNMDIVCENYISPENLKRPTVVTEITKAAFSSDGAWLATVQLWDNGVMSPELILKFWFYQQESQSFILNTLVDTPHIGPVNSLKFRPLNTDVPSTPMVVSSSQDGKFKCWTLTDDTDIYRENSKWMCESVGYYRDRATGAVSFAEDGSLLAVVFGTVITLWNPDTNVLRKTLVAGSKTDNVRTVEFGHGSCCHYLVSTSQHQLVVWDLRSCSVTWCVELNVILLISDPLSESMAVTTDDQTLYIFKPLDPEPSYIHRSVCKEPIVCGAFLPHIKKREVYGTQLSWQQNSQLYLLTLKQKLLSLVFEDEDVEEKSYQELKLTSNLPRTPFSLLMSKGRKSGVTTAEKQSHDALPSRKFTQELMMGASHTQPYVSLMCNKFIQSLLIHKKNSGHNEKSTDQDEEDSDNESADKYSTDSDSDMEIDDEVNSEERLRTKVNSQKSDTSQNASSNMKDHSNNTVCNMADKDSQDEYLEKVLYVDSFEWLSPNS